MIWINFVFALWASVAYYLYLFVWRMMHPEVMAFAWGALGCSRYNSPLLVCIHSRNFVVYAIPGA